MKATPSTLKMNPIVLTAPNLMAFFSIKIKAFQAAAQKFLPVIAI